MQRCANLNMKMAGFAETLFTFIISFTMCLHVYGYTDNYVEDYCWRDYAGTIPKDALKVGHDKNGLPIYAGQALYKNALVPGSLYENMPEMEIEYNEVHRVGEALKILCSKYPERFEWYNTHYDEVIKIKDKYLFETGYEKDYKTYLGRVMTDGGLLVGKISCRTDEFCYKLTTVHKGEWQDYKDFEILTYNPDATATTRTETASRRQPRQPNNPTFLTYFFLVLVIAALIVLVIVLLRRC